MRKILLILVGTLVYMSLYAQFTTGTTGLLNMPTAEMQRDKTFMFGGGFLEKHATPARWTYNTLNYYINITLFPWLEVAYDCTLHKAMKCDPVYGCGFWVQNKEIYNAIVTTVTELATLAPVYHLKCLPDREATELCRKTVEG